MNRKPTTWPGFTAVVLLAVSFFYSAACNDDRRHPTATPPKLPEAKPPIPADAGPMQVARAFLEAARDAQHAREKGFGRIEQKQAYDSAMATLRSLAAASNIHNALRNARSNGVPTDISEEAATTYALESWVSLVAYYVDGFLFDMLTVSPASFETTKTATVRLEAERPEDAARLRQLLAESGAPASTHPAGATAVPAPADSLRAKALALRPPLNIPIRATLEILFVRNQDGWRVAGLRINPASSVPMLPPAAPETPQRTPAPAPAPAAIPTELPPASPS
jgi:hypothetical protein